MFTLMCATVLVSCKKDKVTPEDPTKPASILDDKIKIQTLSNSTHTIDIYADNNKFETGYNKVYFQIKRTNGELVSGATPTWSPVMHMTSMSHACPYSSIGNPNSNAIYEGFIVFIMASNGSEYWSLDITYTDNGTQYTASGTVVVENSSKVRVTTFTGSDTKKYVVAMVEPTKPKTGVNDIKAVVYQMENMMTFTRVDDYSIKIDPRMPSMGNHTSPNNVHLTQNASDKYYYGKLTLTMSGYWKINLQLLNDLGTVLKGDEITGSTTESSIYFEIEY